ncbi:MAG: hypothetical protein SGJ20_11645 [Planctomycetota bacterium]|nr:hypothetical protein [Planctomycetota bacterium]
MSQPNEVTTDNTLDSDSPSHGAAMNRMVLNRTADWKEYAFTALLIVGTTILDWLLSSALDESNRGFGDDFVYYGVMLGQLALAATWLAMGNWPLPARVAGVSLYIAATIVSASFAQEESNLAEWPARTAALVVCVAVAALPMGFCKLFGYRLLRLQKDDSWQGTDEAFGAAPAAIKESSARADSIVDRHPIKSPAAQFTLWRLFSWITTAGMVAALLRLIVEEDGSRDKLVGPFEITAMVSLLLGLILWTMVWGVFNQNKDAASWSWLLGFGLLMVIPFFFVLIPTFGAVLLVFYIYRSFGYRWVRVVNGRIQEAEHATRQ